MDEYLCTQRYIEWYVLQEIDRMLPAASSVLKESLLCVPSLNPLSPAASLFFQASASRCFTELSLSLPCFPRCFVFWQHAPVYSRLDEHPRIFNPFPHPSIDLFVETSLSLGSSRCSFFPCLETFLWAIDEVASTLVTCIRQEDLTILDQSFSNEIAFRRTVDDGCIKIATPFVCVSRKSARSDCNRSKVNNRSQ